MTDIRNEWLLSGLDRLSAVLNEEYTYPHWIDEWNDEMERVNFELSYCGT